MSAGSASLSGITAKQEHYHAFLSHNGADKYLVEQVGEELAKRGLSCWLDKWNLVPGERSQSAIEEALVQCDTCVVFFGPHGLGPWQHEEMRLAIQRRVNSRDRKLRVLPVILPGGRRAKESDLPGFLQGTTWVEFLHSLDEGDAFHRLVCGIRGVPPGRRAGATIQEGECPYIGLETFQPENAPLFFGRTAKIQELIDRLRNDFGTPKQERFLALIGASGSGKSSIALAGLIPAIQRAELPASAAWPLIRCRPGAQPWESLLIALAANQQIAPHLATLPALIGRPEDGRPEDEQRRLHLTARLALHDAPEAHRLFVLIDQFEEIFTLCNEEAARRQLIDNVLYATNVAEGRTIVVLTMRADFYGQCASYPGLRAAIADHQSLIGPLTEEELHEVIEAPAQLAGGEIEPGLMELMLADMKGQSGGLPFLEHALFKLWEIRDGLRLTAKAYRDMGRLAGALDGHAEEFFTKNLSNEEQVLCRQILVDLVRPGEGSMDTKKRVLLDDIATTEAARAALKKLADARLVTTDREARPEAARAELAHEALITGWRRLSEWVNEHREKSRLKERLLDAAREWEKNSKKEDFLYRGAQLAIAEESFGTSREPLARLGSEFLDASLELKNRLRLQEANAALAAYKRLESDSQTNVSFAHHSRETGKNAEALAYLAKALRLNQKNNKAAALTGAMLAQASWPLLVTGPMEHQAAIYSAQFSPDGQRVVTASEDKTAQLWDVASGTKIGKPMQHQAAIYSAQFSPDGQRVVTASEDKTAQLWDVASGTKIGKPMQHAAAVGSAQFSPDGQRVVTASADKTAQLWDVASRRKIGRPMQHEGTVYSAQFSPDGQWVVTASADKTAQLWDVASWRKIGNAIQHEGKVRSARFSPDGQRVVTASDDKKARLWDSVTGKALGQPMQHEAGIRSAQFSPDGQRVVTASEDKTARLWDALSGEPISEPMRHVGKTYSAQFSPDGQRVVTASVATAQLWNVTSGTKIAQPMQHGARVRSAQFSPDGRRVVTALGDTTARLWEAATDNPIGEPMRHDGTVLSAQFSPDGQRVLTTSDDKTARLWDALSGNPISEPMQHGDAVGSAQFSPDGQRVLTASVATAQLWNVASGTKIAQPMQHGARVRSAQFSPDGQRALTASGDNTAQLWDVATGKALGQPMQHRDTVSYAQFSPDGRQVLTASDDKTARLWDALSGKPISEPMQHGDAVSSAQFSPDGQRVLTVSVATAQLWNVASGTKIAQPMHHGARVRSAQFSPDGQRVVTASGDNTAQLWDVATGKPLGQPMQHRNTVSSAQFSPDGQRVLTASDDKTARLWEALSGKPISEPIKHGDAISSAQFSPDGQRVLTASVATAQLWDFPTISDKDSADDVLILADLAEAIGGITLQTSGQEEIQNVLNSEQIQSTWEKIAKRFLRPSSELTPLQLLLKWSVSEPRNRAISPCSQLTVAEWIEQTINERTLDGLRAAMQVDPTNACLAAHLGRGLADRALDNGTDRDEARRAGGEADFQTRRALKLASDNEEVKKLRAEVVKLLQLPE